MAQNVRAETTDATPDEMNSPSDDGDEDADLSRDDIFHVLQCRRRRLVLKFMHEYDGEEPARMSDIAEHIAALEHDTTVRELRSQQRQRVYIALYQSHLPKMDKTGVIEYEQDRGFVETTELAEQFESYLDREPSLLSDDDAEEEDEPALTDEAVDEPVAEPSTLRERGPDSTEWYKRYLYASSGCLLTTVALVSGLWSGTLPSGATVGLLVSAVFALLALSHWVSESSSETEFLESVVPK